jgi:hypothetical protein
MWADDCLVESIIFWGHKARSAHKNMMTVACCFLLSALDAGSFQSSVSKRTYWGHTRNSDFGTGQRGLEGRARCIAAVEWWSIMLGEETGCCSEASQGNTGIRDDPRDRMVAFEGRRGLFDRM